LEIVSNGSEPLRGELQDVISAFKQKYGPKAFSGADLGDIPRPPKLVRYKTDGDISSFDLLVPASLVMGGGEYWYEVECHDCDTAEKLARSIAHLNDKAWFTSEHLRQFTNLVAWEAREKTSCLTADNIKP
jgi:hypothetical protein